MKRTTLLFCAATLLLCGTGSTSYAQAQGAPEQAAQAALELFNQGKYPEAVAAYEKILKDYPTSTVVAEAQFRAGYLYFLLGQFDQSIAMLNKILGPPAPPQIQELAHLLIPKALAAKAAAMPATDTKRLKTFEDAIQKFDEFLKKFPKSDETEGAVYGRALASLQIGKYDDAEKGLRDNLARFAASESILDSQYLLALTLATRAVADLRGENAAAREAASGKFDEALKLLRDIVQKGTNVALANDARFQIGEILSNRAAFAAPDQRADLYQQAIEAYRAVAPREEMLKAQKARLDNVLQRIREAGSRRDIAAVQRLDRLKERELVKTEEIRKKGDLTVTAAIKIGAIYFYRNQFDEARVLLAHQEQFAEDDEQKRDILYYKTLTYALQGIVDKAVAGYDEFMRKFKGDPMAEFLPVALGQLFVRPEVNQPAKAVEYFRQALTIYPKNRFQAEILVAQAQASQMQGRYDEARKAFQQLLGTTPRPDLAARAEFNLAEMDRIEKKNAAALKTYAKVRDTYRGTPEAEQAAYWVPALKAQTNDLKGAAAEFETFLKQFPESQLVPAALFGLAQAKLAMGDKETALARFKEVTEKYPRSQAAPFCYFQRAQIFSGAGKTDDVVAEMKAFIEHHPDDDKVFFAYDTIAQDLLAKGQPVESIRQYEQMANSQPRNPRAPDALQKAADLWRQYAESLGRYIALNEEQRATWKNAVDQSIALARKLVKDYPDSKLVATTLRTLLASQKLLVQAKLASEEEVEKFFTAFAQEFSDRKAVQSKILFTLAAYFHERDKDKALAQMKAAYDPALVYAAADLDLFGATLIDKAEYDLATQVYQKLANDYPNPPNTDPTKAPPDVQEAQAIALFGLGKILQQQKKTAEAGAKFELLKKLYPWSPKILEANFGVAQSHIEKKEFDKATPLLVGIIRAPTATAELRANAMLLVARMAEQKGENDVAIDNYAKIAVFYPGIPGAAAEGLFKAAELIARQLPQIADEKKRAAQKAKAVKYCKDLMNNYGGSEYVEQAKRLLSQLGG